MMSNQREVFYLLYLIVKETQDFVFLKHNIFFIPALTFKLVVIVGIGKTKTVD